MNAKPIIAIMAAVALGSCGKQSSTTVTNEVNTMQVYGKLPDGREAKIFTLSNKNGVIAKVTEYGAILVSVEVPDKSGKVADVTHGYDTLDGNSVEFSYLSKDGEEGYPGNLSVKVTYALNDSNELSWQAEATTDAATVLNIVHHSYWNLSGDPSTSINDHVLQLQADEYLPTNAGLIPSGDLAPVTGTPMDFTTATAIGERVGADFEALKLGGGYDHCWVLRKAEGMRLAARAKDPKSGRVMEISTDQPAIQFYGGNFLDGKAIGKKGVAYAYRTAFCLETENYPDAPNNPSAPSAVLKPGEKYLHRMIFKFSAE